MKIIENTTTGHRYKLLRTAAHTNGELLEMEVRYPPHSAEPPAHFHPKQTEYFRLLAGELSVRMGGEARLYKAGESFTVPPGKEHSMWNSGAQEAVLHWEVVPALQTERLLETLAILANTGKTGPSGVPNLLQTALTMQYFREEFQLTSPPAWLQRAVFGILAPLARLLGYQAVLEEERL